MKSPKLLVLYDDGCPLCRLQVRWLRRLDWVHAIAFAPLSDERAIHATNPHLEREQLLESIHCVEPDGTVHRGARCLRRLSLRIPLLAPLALLLWLPGAMPLAEAAYRRVSQNRHRLSRWLGCDNTCGIPPGTNVDPRDRA